MTDTFWNKVDVGLPDECWVWQRSLRQGYGVYWNGKRNVAAHRHSILLSGREIPEGLVVDHTCRNRACVNPRHLRVVDRRTNIHENSVARAHLNSLKTHCPRGHPLSGDNLIFRHDRNRRVCRTCRAVEQAETQRRRKSRSVPKG